jgi:hypothetical protein
MQHGGGRDAGLNLGLAAFDAFNPIPVSDSVPGLDRQVHRCPTPLRQDPFGPVRGEKTHFCGSERLRPWTCPTIRIRHSIRYIRTQITARKGRFTLAQMCL